MTLNNRYDFVLLFDVKDGNPNGDPDAGNLPRVDAQTGHGLVTDVCLKRKVRNYVGLIKGEQPPYEIYVKEKAVLNQTHERAYKALGISPTPKKESDGVKNWMCQNFYDIRTFGAVMTTDVNSGQVRGPVQMTFSRSVEPIVALEHSITRMAVTNQKDMEKERTMGRKFTVPYGLYRAHGFISAPLATQTGFSEEDLELFWQALESMFEHDRSASRGEISTCGLYLFKHESALGNGHAYDLFERIKVQRRGGQPLARTLDENALPPRSFEDYEVVADERDLPQGVTLIKRVHRTPRVLASV